MHSLSATSKSIPPSRMAPENRVHPAQQLSTSPASNAYVRLMTRRPSTNCQPMPSSTTQGGTALLWRNICHGWELLRRSSWLTWLPCGRRISAQSPIWCRPSRAAGCRNISALNSGVRPGNDAQQPLIATSRWRRVSAARYTSPMPPAPSKPLTWNRPKVVPGAKGIDGIIDAPRRLDAIQRVA